MPAGPATPSGAATADALVVAEASSLEGLRDDWERLVQDDTDVFRSWEWAKAWELAAGAGRRRLLTFARPGGQMVGIARLAELRSAPVRLFGFEGQGRADQVGPVCHPRDRASVAQALRAAVRWRGRRPGVLLARGLMREEGWVPLLDGVVISSDPSPVLRLGDCDWEQWMASKSRNFRHQAGKLERRLQRDHGLSYHQVVEAELLDAALAEMIALHDARWQGGSRFFSPLGRALHVGFARLARERGWLRLWRADLDGRPAAYWLGYLYRGEYWSFQFARDPAHADDSIGFVLLMHAIRCAFGERAVRFHQLSGAYEYKLRIANEDAGHETVLVVSRTLATPVRLGYAAARRLPDPVRGALIRRLPI